MVGTDIYEMFIFLYGLLLQCSIYCSQGDRATAGTHGGDPQRQVGRGRKTQKVGHMDWQSFKEHRDNKRINLTVEKYKRE